MCSDIVTAIAAIETDHLFWIELNYVVLTQHTCFTRSMTPHHQRKRIGNFSYVNYLQILENAKTILNLELVGSSEISFVFVKLSICLDLDIPKTF
jgi:hypothetical protein